MKKSNYSFVLTSFFIWLAVLLFIIFLSTRLLPLQANFLGGGLANYVKNPYLWAFGNYDGEHYVSIARLGYGFGEQAFFPLYPVLIGLVSKIFGSTILSYNISGIVISLMSFLIGLIGFYKLLRIDFSEKVTRLAIVALLTFPTSFYFGAVYTESLFFTLTIWALLMARQKKWLAASLIAMLLTATRFVGIIIIPVILVEWLVSIWKNKDWSKKIPWAVLIAPIGLLSYMLFLLKKVGDPFAFFNTLASFGEQRSSHLILLPQVFYRYMVKILPALHTTFWPTLFTTYLEFVIGLLFLIIICLSFKKLRLSYWFFLLFGYLIPTFSGSFSSLPRYVLVLFPTYILVGLMAAKSKKVFFAIATISFILLVVSFSLFARGYWVS